MNVKHKNFKTVVQHQLDTRPIKIDRFKLSRGPSLTNISNLRSILSQHQPLMEALTARTRQSIESSPNVLQLINQRVIDFQGGQRWSRPSLMRVAPRLEHFYLSQSLSNKTASLSELNQHFDRQLPHPNSFNFDDIGYLYTQAQASIKFTKDFLSPILEKYELNFDFRKTAKDLLRSFHKANLLQHGLTKNFDFAAGQIIFPDPDRLYSALGDIMKSAKRDRVVISRFEDYIINPRFANRYAMVYLDFSNVGIPHIAELKLNLQGMNDILATIGHPIYEFRRDIDHARSVGNIVFSQDDIELAHSIRLIPTPRYESVTRHFIKIGQLFI